MVTRGCNILLPLVLVACECCLSFSVPGKGRNRVAFNHDTHVMRCEQEKIFPRSELPFRYQ